MRAAAEQRIGRGKGARARRHHQLRRQRQPRRRRFIETALPVTAVTAAGEYHRIEHDACMPNRGSGCNKTWNVVMPGLVPGIHGFAHPNEEGVDGRDEAGP
jgi:hypothetical protein